METCLGEFWGVPENTQSENWVSRDTFGSKIHVLPLDGRLAAFLQRPICQLFQEPRAVSIIPYGPCAAAPAPASATRLGQFPRSESVTVMFTVEEAGEVASGRGSELGEASSGVIVVAVD